MRIKILALSFSVLAVVACQTDSIDDQDTNLTESQITNKADVSRSVYQPIPGQYIVTLKKGTFETPVDVFAVSKSASSHKELYLQQINSLKNSLGNSTAKLAGKNISFGFDGSKIISVFRYGIEGFVANLTEQEAENLRKNPNVVDVSNDYLITLAKPTKPGGGTPTPSGQETPWGITRIGGAGNGTGKTAWVVDSGIDLDHPDLNVDVARSLSFAGDNNPDDGNGHGTHVAGTIAALNNNIGVVGVAAGAHVVACKVLSSSGSGDFSWTVQALDYIAAAGQVGDVVNMSLGPESPYIHTATDLATLNVASKGIKIAVAAGNSYDNANLYTPAHNNHQNIYTISASAPGDFLAYFSNWGTCVDYAAPGYNIKSTIPGGYGLMSGTSMASPHAAGVLLLGNPTTSGYVKNGYWEIQGGGLSGNISETNDFRRSTYRYDKDGVQDPIIHR